MARSGDPAERSASPTRRPDADRISLRGIRVWAHHGVHPEERERGQRFVVSVTIELDAARAAAADAVEATVDYATLAQEVAEVAGGGPYALLETVAERIAEVVLAHPPVTAVEVTVDKPDAPLPVPAEGVSVSLRRERGR